jgi:hypothetical protein
VIIVSLLLFQNEEHIEICLYLFIYLLLSLHIPIHFDTDLSHPPPLRYSTSWTRPVSISSSLDHVKERKRHYIVMMMMMMMMILYIHVTCTSIYSDIAVHQSNMYAHNKYIFFNTHTHTQTHTYICIYQDTPFLVILFPHKPEWSKYLLAFVWTVALVGITAAALMKPSKLKGRVSLTLYLALGWSAVLIVQVCVCIYLYVTVVIIYVY